MPSNSARPEAAKRRWSVQIRDALAALHKAGIVWGNTKTRNIIIDKSGNAWVVGFREGHTETWLEGDKAGTVEGDMEGLERILHFMGEMTQTEFVACLI